MWGRGLAHRALGPHSPCTWTPCVHRRTPRNSPQLSVFCGFHIFENNWVRPSLVNYALNRQGSGKEARGMWARSFTPRPRAPTAVSEHRACTLALALGLQLCGSPHPLGWTALCPGLGYFQQRKKQGRYSQTVHKQQESCQNLKPKTLRPGRKLKS